jgi:hypothetical protein
MLKRKRKAKPTVVAFDLRNPMSYEGIKDIYHAVGRTSRSSSEAFKDADYASAFWICESDFVATMRFLREMLEGMVVVFMTLFIPILVIVWLVK